MDARTRVNARVVGALPVVGAMLEQWGLADIVDRVAPWDGDVPLGTLVETLVINRLLNPKAMYAVGDWAAQASVTDYFGLTAQQLNDDRLGRALERVADYGMELQSAATLSAVGIYHVGHRPKIRIVLVEADAESDGAGASLVASVKTTVRERGSPLVRTLLWEETHEEVNDSTRPDHDPRAQGPLTLLRVEVGEAAA